jgi:hypothetical protein
VNIDYIHAHSLGALYLPLSRQLHAERLKLLPQTPQTIVVGNLDTEGYLQRRLVEEDGVLMGVNFPFLESAIESFSARIRQQAAPKVNESWFTPPREKRDGKPQSHYFRSGNGDARNLAESRA